MMAAEQYGDALDAALRELQRAHERISALEKDAARWQPIETADSNALALLYAPPEALFVEPAKHLGEFRVAAPRNWTWATHWMPLPAPPAARPPALEPYPRCTRLLREAGKPYPRTCQECGLGPCARERT